MFATGSMDRTAKYFRCDDKHYHFVSSTELISTPVTAIDFAEEGKWLYTAANDVLKVWNMAKNGLLLESIEASSKGIQDIKVAKNGLIGVAFSAGVLSLWVCNLSQKIKNNSATQ